MVLKLRAAPGRYIRAAQPATRDRRLPRLNVTKLQDNTVSDQYVREVARLRQAAAPGFSSLSQDLYQAGVSVLGTAQCSAADWRAGHDTVLRAAAARRQQALEARRLSPDSPACLQELQDARHASRRLVRDLKARWWSDRLQRLEAAARRNDAAAAFSDAKEMGRLLRSQGVVVEPLAVSPDADLMAKAAHFQAVLNVQRPVSDDVWNDIPDLSLIFRGILLRSMSYGTPSSSCPMANLLTRQASTRSS